jgi:hypothetical protein
VHLLIHAPAIGSHLPQIVPDRGDLATVAVGLLANPFQHADGGKLWILGQQRIDLRLEGIEQAASSRLASLVGRTVHAESFPDRLVAATQSPHDGPLREFLDLCQATNLGPQGDFHGFRFP